MNFWGGIFAVLLLFSFVSFAAAEEIQSVSSEASASGSVKAAPLKERAQAFREDLREARERIQDAKEKRKELEKEFKEKDNELRKNRAQIRDEAKERLKELKEERNEQLQNAREKVKNVEDRLKELRLKVNLSAEEKSELKVKVLDHLQASFDQRIRAAKRLETEGVNATLVAEFVAFAEAQKGKLVNATNNTVRKNLIVEFNQKWRAFKQAAKQDLKKVRLREVIAKSAEALAKLDGTIARLKTAGFNVTALEDASAKIRLRLDLAANASTFEQSMVHLRASNRGLVFLKKAIRLTLRKEKVELLIDQIEAQITAKVDASVNASTGVNATTTPSPNAPSLATPTPSPASTPAPVPSVSPSPTPSASPTPIANVTANVTV